jgi:hypothetical protein
LTATQHGDAQAARVRDRTYSTERNYWDEAQAAAAEGVALSEPLTGAEVALHLKTGLDAPRGQLGGRSIQAPDTRPPGRPPREPGPADARAALPGRSGRTVQRVD